MKGIEGSTPSDDTSHANVVEQADTPHSKRGAPKGRAGSIPAVGTNRVAVVEWQTR